VDAFSDGIFGTMHADVAGIQLGGRLAQVSAAHEGQEHLELFQFEFFVDLHGALEQWQLFGLAYRAKMPLAYVHPAMVAIWLQCNLQALPISSIYLTD